MPTVRSNGNAVASDLVVGVVGVVLGIVVVDGLVFFLGSRTVILDVTIACSIPVNIKKVPGT